MRTRLFAMTLCLGLVAWGGCAPSAPPPVADPTGAATTEASATGTPTAAATSTSTATTKTMPAGTTTAATKPETPATPVTSAASGDAPAFTAYVADTFIGAVIVHPAKALASPLVKQSPADQFAAQGEAMAGVHPQDIERAIVFLDAGSEKHPQGSLAVYVQFKAPTDIVALLKEKFPNVKETMIAGKACWHDEGTGRYEDFGAVFLIDDRSALAAETSTLERMLKASGSGPLAARIKTLDINHDAVAVGVAATAQDKIDQFLFEANEQMPEELKKYLELADLVKSVAVNLDVQGGDLLSFNVEANDEAAAAKVKSLLEDAIDEGRQALPIARGMAIRDDMPFQGLATQGADAIEKIATELAPQQAGREVVITITTPEMLKDVPKLMEEVQKAMAEGAVLAEAAELVRQENGLHQVQLAIHLFETQNLRFPWAKQENAGLSWRVGLLPNLERGDLYRKYDMKQPWDSETNKPLSEQRISILTTALDPMEHWTRIQKVTGPVAEKDGKPTETFTDITDGTANTIMLVQVGPDKSVPWAKPADVVYDPELGLASFGEIPGDTVIVGMYDGSTRRIKKEKLTPEILKALITPAGGEAIDWDAIKD